MVMSAGYIPDRGDAVWITFDPQAGYEQAGRRPALSDQVKCLDWRARHARHAAALPDAVGAQLLGRTRTLFE